MFLLVLLVVCVWFFSLFSHFFLRCSQLIYAHRRPCVAILIPGYTGVLSVSYCVILHAESNCYFFLFSSQCPAVSTVRVTVILALLYASSDWRWHLFAIRQHRQDIRSHIQTHVHALTRSHAHARSMTNPPCLHSALHTISCLPSG